MSNSARSENEAEDNSEMAFSWNLMSFCENMFSQSSWKSFQVNPFRQPLTLVKRYETEHGRDEKSIDEKKFKYDKNMTFKWFWQTKRWGYKYKIQCGDHFDVAVRTTFDFFTFFRALFRSPKHVLDRHATTKQDLKTFWGKFRQVERTKQFEIFLHKPS